MTTVAAARGAAVSTYSGLRVAASTIVVRTRIAGI